MFLLKKIENNVRYPMLEGEEQRQPQMFENRVLFRILYTGSYGCIW